MPITSSSLIGRSVTSSSVSVSVAAAGRRQQIHHARHNAARTSGRIHSNANMVFSSVVGPMLCCSGRLYSTQSSSSSSSSSRNDSSSSSTSSGWRRLSTTTRTSIGVMCCAATVTLGVGLYWSQQYQKREFTRVPANLIKPPRSLQQDQDQQHDAPLSAAEYPDENLLFGFESEFLEKDNDKSFYLTSAAACKSKLSTAISSIGPTDIDHRVSEDEIDRCDCGEDSFFLLSAKNISAIGVADGVGGWSNMGVNPKEFSGRLMKNCFLEINAAEESPKNPANNVPAIGVSNALPSALDALSAAYQKIHVEQQVFAGSSTACIIVLDGQDKALNFANIGDSAFMLVREGRILIRSKEQQHAFNAPFQLGIIPQRMKSSNSLDNKPSDADTAKNARIAIQEGDIIIMGTDGLFDNVFDREIAQMLKSCGKNLHQAARKLVVFASECMARNRDGPFAQNARSNGYSYRGAKPDDVTVIVARVDAHQYSPAPSMREPNQIPPAP